VACPACQHRARGVTFGAVEAPRAVIVMPEAGATERRPTPRRPDRRAAAPRELADDQEQTHLVLDLPCEEDDAVAATAQDPRALALGRSPSTVRAKPALDADQERTHLLLDANDWAEEDPPADASGQERTRVRLEGRDALGAEERTRLQLGLLSLRTGDHSPLSRGVAGLGWLVRVLLQLSVWLEEALHGREAGALAAIALSCGFIAPVLDYSLTGSTLSGFTLSCQLLALTLLGVLQLNGLRDDEGKWDPRVAVHRLQTAAQLSIESVGQFAASPRYVMWGLLSQALVLAGLTGLAWAAFLDVVWWLWGLPAGFSSLPLLNGLTLLGAVGMQRHAQRLAPTPRFSLHELGNSVAAAAALPPLVDLSDPLPDALPGGSTALHQCLGALSRWQPREWPDEAAYRAALQRHLQRQLTALPVERERWLGRSRLDGVIDLAVDGMIVIGVQRGVDTPAAQRALGKMRRHARAWSGKPMILAIFAAPGEAALENSTTAAWVDLRKDCALLTVRMPTH